MTGIRIQTLGEFAVLIGGQQVQLPASRRARALLAYLLLNNKAHRREHLCELLWWMPDDPRGALRWALSKLRPIVNDDHAERLSADREHVRLTASDIAIDCLEIAAELDRDEISVQRLDAILEHLEAPLLDGIDVADQPLFQEWLNAERKNAKHLAASALRRLAEHPGLEPKRSLLIARRWSELEPFSRAAANHLLVYPATNSVTFRV